VAFDLVINAPFYVLVMTYAVVQLFLHVPKRIIGGMTLSLSLSLSLSLLLASLSLILLL
jgi:hypothetical protein